MTKSTLPTPKHPIPKHPTTAHDILSIIAETGGVARERLTPDARLADLSIASLDLIEIVFALEERFEIAIPFTAPVDGMEGRVEFETVGDVVNAVLALVMPTIAPDAMPVVASPEGRLAGRRDGERFATSLGFRSATMSG